MASALALATPFLLAALGETLGQRSGVINLGVDGIMLLSAFTTYFAALKTGDLLVAVLVGMGTGLVMGVVTAFVSVTLKAEQGISGIGVYLFGLGFSDLLFIKLVGTPLPINQLNPIGIPLLDKIPAIGGMFFKQTILVYLAFALVPVVTFVLNRTTFGLKIKAAGENPAAADTVGVSVPRIRWATVLLYKSGKTKGAGRYPPPPPAPTTQQTGERQDLDDNRNRYPPPPPAPTAQQTGERQDLDDPPHWLK